MLHYGFNEFFAAQITEKEKKYIGRVIEVQRGLVKVVCLKGEFWAELSGKFFIGNTLHPVVGDWVTIEPFSADRALILRILNRKSKFSRQDPAQGEQVIVANIDLAFVVTSLNEDFNLRRIERYLSVIWESGAEPGIWLTKSDLCKDVKAVLSQVESIAIGVPIWVVSALSGEGIEQIHTAITEGKTAVLLGSSGVGKSTLVNALLGEQTQKTQSIREDDAKGRHTTTARKLFVLDNGGLLIDTPGLREIQIWEAGQGMGQAFQDIEQLKRACRFNDCKHETEPGCAILGALESGELDPKRLASFQKLEREAAYQARKNDKALQAQERKKWRKIQMDYDAKKKLRKRD